jgi:hypothetical protein
MHSPIPAHELQQHADRLGCCTRTVRRMIRRGVDPANNEAVANYLLTLRAPSARMLERVIEATSPTERHEDPPETPIQA